MVDVLRAAGGVVATLRRAVDSLLPDGRTEIEDAGAPSPAPPSERFRWEAEMLDPVADSMLTLAPWLEAPAALIAEVPAAVGVVDLLGVRFDERALRCRLEADVRPILSPLRVRVLYALLAGPRRVDELAASVGTRGEALLRSTLRPLEDAELVELDRDKARSTGLWLPVAQRVVAVELKLTKWRDALDQADNFRRSADETWVIVDAARAGAARSATLEFAERGVGLALAAVDGCVDLVLPPAEAQPEGWLRALIAERALAAADEEAPLFWRGRRRRRPRLESDPRAVAVVA